MPKSTFLNLPKEKQNRIINSAIEEFSIYEYSTSSINRIVKNAEISKGSFYQYFEDKLDLFLYIVTYIGDIKMSFLTTHGDFSSENDFFDFFRELYLVGLKFVIAYPEFHSISIHIFKNTNLELKNAMMKLMLNQDFSFITNVLEKAQKNGTIRNNINNQTVMQLLVQLNMTATEVFLNEEGHFPNDEASSAKYMQYIDEILDIFKNGIAVK